jgi:hypothetical protein
MLVSEVTDFDTDLSAHCDTPLCPVEVVRGLDPETFQQRFVRPGIRVVLDDQVSTWPALERWTDAAYPTGLAAGRAVFARDL